MAGDWIKLEVSTPEKSEVLAITASMGWDDADLTVGKLFRMWRWFDQHTIDGNAVRVTPALLDRIVGVSGFCDAVQQVGWLLITEDGVMLPKFDRHNGSSAKARAQTSKRVAKHKANAQGNGQSNADSVSDALPREEKKREEISIPNGIEDSSPKRGKPAVVKPEGVSDSVWQDFLAIRKAKRSPLTATALQGIEAEAVKAGLTLQQALLTCCARGWQGFNAEWMDGRTQSPQTMTFAERDVQLKRKRWEEMTGRKWPEQSGEIIDMDEAKFKFLGVAP